MNQFSMRTLTITVALVLLYGARTVHAQTRSIVDCDAGGRIAVTLSAARPGDTIQVRGTCKEQVSILNEITRITLDGGGVATISHPGGPQSGATAHAIFIRATGITVTGFRVKGGVDGIHLSGPAHAIISRNTIEGNSRRGIHVDKGSVAQIMNNTIQGNTGGGIHVTENSTARIGLIIPPDPTLQPNQILNNGRYGIRVERNSSAWILGNTVSSNAGPGIIIDRNSEADIAANSINANTADGIVVSRNSGANLSTEDAGRSDRPNATDPRLQNRGVAIRCSIGSYVAGPLGTLQGVAGVKAFDSTCVDRVAVR
jgi:parallel beta-helix repeat protein